MIYDHIKSDIKFSVYYSLSYTLSSAMIHIGHDIIPIWLTCIKNTIYFAFLLGYLAISKTQILYHYIDVMNMHIKHIINKNTITNQKAEKRKFKRKRTCGLYTLTVLGNSITVYGNAVDVSSYGMRIIIDKRSYFKIRAGQILQVTNSNTLKQYKVMWRKVCCGQVNIGLCTI